LYFKKKEILVLFLTNCHPLTKKMHKNIKNTTNILDKITKKNLPATGRFFKFIMYVPDVQMKVCVFL